jgi:hypothetical protein
MFAFLSGFEAPFGVQGRSTGADVVAFVNLRRTV